VFRNQRGQVMVEFALCIIIFMLFMYGLITMLLWSIVAYWTQETAHEVARKYAVQDDKAAAIETGYKKVNILGAGYFIEPKSTVIEVYAPKHPEHGDVATATVTTVPTIKKLFVFSMPEITRESEAMLEDHRLYYDDKYKKYIGNY
jgi:hypothetical protein